MAKVAVKSSRGESQSGPITLHPVKSSNAFIYSLAYLFSQFDENMFTDKSCSSVEEAVRKGILEEKLVSIKIMKRKNAL